MVRVFTILLLIGMLSPNVAAADPPTAVVVVESNSSTVTAEAVRILITASGSVRAVPIAQAPHRSASFLTLVFRGAGHPMHLFLSDAAGHSHRSVSVAPRRSARFRSANDARWVAREALRFLRAHPLLPSSTQPPTHVAQATYPMDSEVLNPWEVTGNTRSRVVDPWTRTSTTSSSTTSNSRASRRHRPARTVAEVLDPWSTGERTASSRQEVLDPWATESADRLRSPQRARRARRR